MNDSNERSMHEIGFVLCRALPKSQALGILITRSTRKSYKKISPPPQKKKTPPKLTFKKKPLKQK